MKFRIVALLLLSSLFVTAVARPYLHVEVKGEGVPILFLHGHTLDNRMWEPQVKFFADRYKVVCMEFRGYGKSSPQVVGESFTHADDVLYVLDSLHLDKVHLVGLSMGSFVASELVALHPERFLSATLASGNIRKCKGPGEPFDSLEVQKIEAEIARNKEMGVDVWKQNWINMLVDGGGSNRESIRESVTRQVQDWDAFQLLNAEVRLYYGNQAWDSLRAKCPELPVLILSGENEHKGKNPMLPFLPNGRQVIIPDCGHMSNMEKPEEFNRLVQENINRAQ